MKYVLRKICGMILTLLVISFLVYLAFDLVSGDPAVSMLGTQATPERLEQLREEMGLNHPFLIRYGSYIAGLFTGDMGVSYSYQMPVRQMIGDKLPITLTLTGMSFLLMAGLSVIIALYTVRHEGGWADGCIQVLNQIIMSIPPFFSGVLITFLLGLGLKLFTPGGFVSYSKNPGQFFYYLIFPAMAIAFPKCAMAVKLLRGSLLDELKKDYVRTAYSRGNSRRSVIRFHALKNALIPAITFWGMALCDMLAGSIIVEQVFGIPGLGRILLVSISNRDYPVVEAIVLLIAVWVLVINVAVDLIYKAVDPRIS